MPDQLKAEITLHVHLHFSAVCDFLERVYFRPLISLRAYSNRFLMLRNHMGMVVPRAFHLYLTLSTKSNLMHIAP